MEELGNQRFSVQHVGDNIRLTILRPEEHDTVSIDLTESEVYFLKNCLGPGKVPEESVIPRVIIGLELSEAEAARWDALQEVHGQMMHGPDAGWDERIARASQYCIAQCTAILDSKKNMT